MAYEGNNRYLLAVVVPIRDGRWQAKEVHIYERLDPFPKFPNSAGVQHIKFCTSFPLWDNHKGRNLSLTEIQSRVEKIVQGEEIKINLLH